MDDPTLDGDGSCCVDVVSCHHAHCDASTLTLLDGIRNLRSVSTSTLFKKHTLTSVIKVVFLVLYFVRLQNVI